MLTSKRSVLVIFRLISETHEVKMGGGFDVRKFASISTCELQRQYALRRIETDPLTLLVIIKLINYCILKCYQQSGSVAVSQTV